MASKKVTKVQADSAPIEKDFWGGKLDPKEEKVLDWILNGIIVFVLGWLALGIGMAVLGLFGVWK